MIKSFRVQLVSLLPCHTRTVKMEEWRETGKKGAKKKNSPDMKLCKAVLKVATLNSYNTQYSGI